MPVRFHAAGEINGLSSSSGNYMRDLFVLSTQWLKMWKHKGFFYISTRYDLLGLILLLLLAGLKRETFF